MIISPHTVCVCGITIKLEVEEVKLRVSYRVFEHTVSCQANLHQAEKIAVATSVLSVRKYEKFYADNKGLNGLCYNVTIYVWDVNGYICL